MMEGEILMKKSIRNMVTSLSVLSMLVISVNAIGPVFGYRLKNGIGNVAIYIDGNTYPRATYWQGLIKNAVNNWMYTGYGGNNFYATYVSSSSNGSNVDIYGATSCKWGTLNVLAETTFWDNYVAVQPTQKNWYYAEIYLNDDALSQNIISNEVATGTFAHEFGHAFGLAHANSNTNSIMCQLAYGRLVNTVQKVDNDTLNYLYP